MYLKLPSLKNSSVVNNVYRSLVALVSSVLPLLTTLFSEKFQRRVTYFS